MTKTSIKPTGKSILGLIEYQLDDVVFLVKPGKQKLILAFSAFAAKGVEPRYNNIRNFIDYDYAWIGFLDTKGSDKDPRGTYYIDGKNNYQNTILKIAELFQKEFGITQQETYFIGSSKGASAALIHGLRAGYGNCIVHAPQYFIADYLHKPSAKYIYAHMCGRKDDISGKGRKHDDVNNYIRNLIYKKGKKPKIHLTCGVDDSIYETHIKPLMEDIKNANISLNFTEVRGGHGGVALRDYKKKFMKLLSMPRLKQQVTTNNPQKQ